MLRGIIRDKTGEELIVSELYMNDIIEIYDKDIGRQITEARGAPLPYISFMLPCKMLNNQSNMIDWIKTTLVLCGIEVGVFDSDLNIVYSIGRFIPKAVMFETANWYSGENTSGALIFTMYI